MTRKQIERYLRFVVGLPAGRVRKMLLLPDDELTVVVRGFAEERRD